MKKTEHNDEKQLQDDSLINSLYFDAKNDYRASVGLEQSVLSLAVAVLALGTAAGFTLFGKLESWIAFAIVIPFFLSMVNIVFLHQKHRSKTYKAYIFELEKKLSASDGYENWKTKKASKFVLMRIGFYFCMIMIQFMVSPLYMGIAFSSFVPDINAVPDKYLMIVFYLIVAFTVISDIVCICYAVSIRKMNKKCKG